MGTISWYKRVQQILKICNFVGLLDDFLKIYEKAQWLHFSLDTQPEIKICNGL